MPILCKRKPAKRAGVKEFLEEISSLSVKTVPLKKKKVTARSCWEALESGQEEETWAFLPPS